jgi:hypothetical protein
MTDSFLGLVMEISADPSKAEEALQEFEKSTGKSFEQAAAGTAPLDTALLSNRESVRLLSEEFGIRMPRAVSGALAEIMPGISALGPALLGAFALSEIPKFIAGIKEATDNISGFGKEAEKAFEDAVAASDKAIVSFKTIKEGVKLSDEVNRNIAALTVQRDLLDSTGGAAVNWARATMAFLSGQTVQAAAYAVMAQQQKLDAEQLGKLEKERLQQLGTMNELQKTGRKEEGEAADKLARKIAEGWREIHRWQLERPKAVRELMEGAKAYDAALAASAEKARQADLFVKSLILDEIREIQTDQQNIQVARTAIPVIQEEVEITKHLSAARKELIWITQSAREAQGQWVSGLKDEIAAVQGDLMGNVQAFTEGLAGLIGGRKAQAGVEAVWETARGIALLAEGSWPPNPVAILAAGLHFEAAAQYAMMAGSGGGRRSGGGAGSYGSGVDHSGGYGTGAGSMPNMPQTLAPGAGGGDGRFGNLHVLVMGERQAAQHIAGILNRGVNNGVTLNATTSQRGAPVGH